MEYDIDQIRKDAEITKGSLIDRQNTKPPMSMRMTMSVNKLIGYFNTTLFLCSAITKLRDENRQLKLDIDHIKKLAENGQS